MVSSTLPQIEQVGNIKLCFEDFGIALTSNLFCDNDHKKIPKFVKYFSYPQLFLDR